MAGLWVGSAVERWGGLVWKREGEEIYAGYLLRRRVG